MKVTYHLKIGREHHTWEVDEPDDATDEELQKAAEDRALENVDIWFEKK